MKGFIVYQDYTEIDNQLYIQLFGRLENGQSFASLNKLDPYFFIKTSQLEKAKKLLSKFKVEKTKLTNFQGEEVTKISSANLPDLNKLGSAIRSLEIETYESDIKPYYRFIIDQDLLGSIEISGYYESSERVDRIYKNPDIKPSNYIPELKVLSLDLESDEAGNLFCIGIYGKDFKKNFLISDQKLKDTINCKDEADCLEKAKAEIIKIDPDIITGWNIADFDFKYLQELFRKHKIQFDIGRTTSNIRVKVSDNFFRPSTVEIPGRQVLDGLSLIKDPFIQEAPSIKHADFDTYTLEDIAQAILGEGKHIKGKGRHEEIEKLYKNKKDQQKLVDYNLQDCKLAYDILIKTKMLDLAIERSQLTGMPFDKMTASIVAFDSLYIREARKRNLVSPSTEYGKKESKIIGGYVKEPNPGIYNNVIVLDFKSLYPSIITTFNIDPASFLKKKEKNSIESPNGAFFRNTEGIMPEIIKRLHSAREKAKKEKRELSSYAIKIIMNSFYGCLASQNSRYFDFDLASSITHFAQFIIKLTAKEIEKIGYQTIYSDTDSVFITTKLDKNKSLALGKEIQDKINIFYKKYIKDNYNRESYLELQFEKLYLSIMFPNVRTKDDEESSKGARKRYAGLKIKDGKEELEIIGLEAIRGDWTEAAKEFQKELLMKVFHQEEVDKFIKSYIKKINEGKLDSQLIYKKSIRKKLDEYTKTTPPHVKAARKLPSLESNIIQYYITTDGPEPIQKLEHALDYDHYIKKQIEPIANQVLNLFGKTMEDLMKSTKQAKLF
jgi:DNA polymerase-2